MLTRLEEFEQDVKDELVKRTGVSKIKVDASPYRSYDIHLSYDKNGTYLVDVYSAIRLDGRYGEAMDYAVKTIKLNEAKVHGKLGKTKNPCMRKRRHNPSDNWELLMATDGALEFKDLVSAIKPFGLSAKQYDIDDDSLYIAIYRGTAPTKAEIDYDLTGTYKKSLAKSKPKNWELLIAEGEMLDPSLLAHCLSRFNVKTRSYDMGDENTYVVLYRGDPPRKREVFGEYYGG